MKRAIHAFGALVMTACLFGSLNAMPQKRDPAKAIMIGAEKPVFLSRLVVTATALPDEQAREQRNPIAHPAPPISSSTAE